MEVMEQREQGFRAYFRLLTELNGVLEQLTEIDVEKAAAVRTGDLNALNACMKREQAAGMALRGMESRRAAAAADLGLSDAPLSALAEHCPEPLRREAKALAEGLRERYAVYGSAAEAARTALECGLHEIERMLADGGEAPPQPPEPPAPMRADLRA